MPSKDGGLPATKADLDGLEDRLESKIGAVDKKLDSAVDRLSLEITKTNMRVDKLGTAIMGELRGFRAELLKAFESSVMKGKAYEDKMLTHKDMFVSHEGRLADHEKRLSSLESKR